MKEHFWRSLEELDYASQINRVTRNIDGWLTELEGVALFNAAQHGPGDGSIVEIGSFKGKSTVWLASGSRHAGREKVFAVDTHKGSQEHQPGGDYASHMPSEGTTEYVFRQNIHLARVEDWVEPLIMTSREAAARWTNPIRLLFIDGDHSYEAVRNDFFDWEVHVVSGGIIAFHDVDRVDNLHGELNGPTKVVYQDIANTDLYSPPIIVNHLAFVYKAKIF